MAAGVAIGAVATRGLARSLSLKRVEGCGCRLSHTDQVIRWETKTGSRTDVANPHWRAKGALFTRARDVCRLPLTGLPEVRAWMARFTRPLV